MFSSCDTGISGSGLENEPPSTQLTLESINRGGDFRLSSQINISWWGNDTDGFVVGYEYAINDTLEGDWTFTTKLDSTFILPITEGNIEDDVLFKVRAIDNDGARDPVGARLVFPIVNSDPTVSINLNESPPDTLFAIHSFGWTVNDPDGLANINRTEIALNDTINGWVEIPLSEDEDNIFISIEIDNTTIGEKEGKVFLGRSFTTAVNSQGEQLSIPGIEVGETNTFYVRVVDAAGAISELDSLSWFIKPQLSRVLFLNDDGSATSLSKQNQHLGYLSEVGIIPDVWLINTGTVTQDKISLSDQFPSVTDPTLKRTLAKWSHIYWISDDIDRNITYALDITSNFFQEGGSMFVNIPMKQINLNDEVLNFIPVDSLGVLTGTNTGFLINANTDVEPVSGNDLSTVLSTSSRQVGVIPLQSQPNATPLYTVDFRTTTLTGSTRDYEGTEHIVIENSEGNLIYLGLDLLNLDGSNNVSLMFEELLIGRLNFKQQ